MCRIFFAPVDLHVCGVRIATLPYTPHDMLCRMPWHPVDIGAFAPGVLFGGGVGGRSGSCGRGLATSPFSFDRHPHQFMSWLA